METITIFKYANRKLYQPKGGYLTLDDVANLIRQGKQVQVIDKGRDSIGKPSDKNGQDITSDVLKQVLTQLALPDTIVIDLINRHRGVNDAN
jgi:polyhydroxyalkanoate synthesis regulator protein